VVERERQPSLWLGVKQTEERWVRQMVTRSKSSKRKLPNIQVAIEIQRSELTLVVAKRDGGNLTEIRGHHILWLQEAESLRTADGVRELRPRSRRLSARKGSRALRLMFR